MEATFEEIKYRPSGPIKDLFLGPGKHVGANFSEVLIEGAANTGKSYGVIQWMHQLCKEAPANTRILWVRQTLQSMRESVQITFEEKVLRDDEAYRRVLLHGPSRDNRRSYDYPGGAHIALGGLDHAERLYSTEWDIVWLEEAVEASLQDYLKFHRALRNGALGFHLLLATTNPKSQYHWLNRRFPAGHRRMPRGEHTDGLLRLLSRHEDNPTCDAAFLANLEALPEPLRSQLFLGAWVSASGLVWPQYDEGRHLIDATLMLDNNSQWTLAIDDVVRRVKWFGASMDFGYRAPGCLGVWAVLDDNTSVLVREVYHAGWQQEQWAEVIEELNAETPISRIIGDCAEPRFLDYLNERLSFARGHAVGTIVQAADKSKGKIHGVNAVRRALDQDMIRFLHPEARMRHWPDKTLPEDAPTCSTEEILSYVYPDPDRAGTPEAKLKREQTEQPDPTCVDHGCDMIEYWCTSMYGDFNMDFAKQPKPKPPTEGTAGWALNLPDSGSKGRRR